MFKNYFTLNRHIVELNKILCGSSLVQAFTQEKDKLVLNFIKNDLALFVEINTDSALPYLILKSQFKRAKKNTLDFFKNFLPADLISIQIAEFDRVVKFSFEKFSIYFLIRGKHTNVVLIDSERNLQSFKKILDENEILNLNNLTYSDSFIKPDIDISITNNLRELLNKSYPFLGKEIVQELLQRTKLGNDKNIQTIFHEILNEIQNNKPIVYQDEKNVFNFSFFESSIKPDKQAEYFESVNDALKFFIIQLGKKTIDTEKTKLKTNYIKKLEQLENKRNKLEERILAGNKYQYYQSIGDILLINKHKLKQGLNKIELEDFDNKSITIELNPKLKPLEIIEYYYNKAKSEQKDYEKSKELLESVKKEIINLKDKLEKIDLANSEESKTEIFKGVIEAKAKSKSAQTTTFKFREFILYEKYKILVGKDSKSNDELTTKYAKKNDYWFHARNVSGSHVVLRWDKSLGEIQKNILEKAASIAAFYSKAKTSGLVPVSYTQKKNVVKRKGMEPGKVALLKEKVLLVKPEIPKECKLVTDQLN